MKLSHVTGSMLLLMYIIHQISGWHFTFDVFAELPVKCEGDAITFCFHSVVALVKGKPICLTVDVNVVTRAINHDLKA